MREESEIVAFVGPSDPDADTGEIPAVRSRPGWLLPLILIGGAIAIGVLGVILGTILWDPAPAPLASNESTTTSQDAPSTSAGTTTTPARPVLEIEPTGAEASGQLEDAGEITYGPENTLDGDPESAWNSNLPDRLRTQTSFSPDEAPWLSFDFPEPIELVAVTFINGYDKGERWGQNHRLRRVRVVVDEEASEVTLADSRILQTIEGDFGEGSTVRLEILEIYPGSGVPVSGGGDLPPDIALSEVEFWGRRAE